MKYRDILFDVAHSVFLFFLLAAAAAAAAATTAYADVPLTRDTQITLSLDEARTFDAAFHALARQGKMAFVIEGRPLKTTLTEREAQALPKSGRLSSLLELLCRQYDYRVLIGQDGKPPFEDVVVLQKKYTQTIDIPGVTIGECLAAMEDTQRIVARYGGGSRPDRKQIIMTALNSLSKEQTARLSEGIPVKTLSPTQKNNFFRVASFFYLGSNFDYLHSCRFTLANASGVTAARTNYPHYHGKPQVTYSLTDFMGTVTKPFNPYVQLFGFDIVPASLKPMLDALPKQALPPTLGEAARQVQPQPQMPAYLAAKPLTFINNPQPSASASHLIKAFALVYGLQALQSEVGVWRIERRRRQMRYQLDNVYAAIKEVMPAPLMQAVTQSPKRLPPVSQASHQAAIDSFRATQAEKDDYFRVGYIARDCGRRLEVLYKAKAKGNMNFSATLKDLGPEAEQDFAVLTMADYLRSIKDSLRGGPPIYITDFDNTVAVGAVGNGAFQVGLSRFNKSGTPVPMVNMGVPRR